MAGRVQPRALLVFVVVVAMFAAGCDWQQFGYDAGNTHSSGDPLIGATNVGTLSATWIGNAGATINGGIAVVKGRAYVGTNNNTVAVFDTSAPGCSGTPKVCTPAWTASVGAPVNGAPAVVDGVLYAKSSTGALAAFDAAGVTGCAGTPTVCAPLWTATLGAGASSPVVADGVLYVGTQTGLRAFDAKGVTGCAGAPRTCTPLWTAPTATASSLPAVANGTVAVGSDRLDAFDAAGVVGCSGAPKTCAPMWTSAPGNGMGAPSIADGRIHVEDLDGVSTFATAAGASCAGAPKVCPPLWTAPRAGGGTLAVGQGVVYSVGASVAAYAADGITGCGGSPRVCTPLWTSATAGVSGLSPVLDNGLLYLADHDKALSVFDANGITGCTGAPKTCVAVYHSAVPAIPSVSPALAQGVVYLATGSRLSAYAPVAYTRPTCAANPHVGLSPCAIQDAYRLPSATAGQDQTIAIVDAFNDPKAESDLAVYRAAYGLPPCTSATGCFTKVNQRGVAGSYPAADAGWTVEISLDLDMVSAACPRCRILLVEADDNTTANLTAAARYAAGVRPVAVSNSYGGPESGGDATRFPSVVPNGVAVVVSTGDGGFGVSFPASAPNVVAVGGTNLLAAPATARGWSETAWDGAGSGCSTVQAKPVWQTDGGCSHRVLADVSAIAGDPGLAVYDSYGGAPGWITVAGTSASAPIIAGIYGLAPTAGRPDTLWSNPSELFDVTSGANGTCTVTYLCTAGTGFDGPTGNGTPCGTRAFSLVAGIAARCTDLGTTAGLHAAILPRPRPLIATPVCPPVPPGRMRCLSLRVTG